MELRAAKMTGEMTAVTYGSRPLIPELRLYKLLNMRRDNFKHYYRFRAVPNHCRPRASRVIKAHRVTGNQRPKVPKVRAAAQFLTQLYV